MYVRIMIDDEDDSVTTEKFAKLTKNSIDINEQIYVPLKSKSLKVEGKGQDDEITLYVLVCINTEEELSYADEIVFEAELKVDSEYFDQREKQLDLKLNLAGVDEPMFPDEESQKNKAVLKLAMRFCFSKITFLESLLSDLNALTSKEQEYMDYLDGCMNSINFVIVKTQAIVRGWKVRKAMKK